jgi:SMI1 / KNR4 family (SUKH-1)
MLNLSELIEIARARPGVTVHPSEQLPSSGTENLPVELVEFYGLCNGIDFYTDDVYRENVDLYTLEFFPKQSMEYLDTAYGEWICNGIDVKRNFLSFGTDPYGNCFCFDTEPTRHGEIYEVSFSEPVIRVSDTLTEFLERILDLNSNYPNWRTLENYEDKNLHPCSEDSLEIQIQRRTQSVS